MINDFYDKFIFTSGIKYKHHNLFLRHIPFVMAPSEIIAGLLDKDEEFEKMVYYSFKSSSRKCLDEQVRKVFASSPEKFLDFCEAYFVASGWGKIENIKLDFDNKRAIIGLRDSPFPNLIHSNGKPVDHLIRGILAGMFSIVFQEDVDCIETKCVASGSDVCSFIIKRKQDFDFSKARVREQLEMD